MPLLKNKTLEKLAKEGRISKFESPVSPEKYKKIVQKLKSFDKQMYEALQNSKRVPYL